MTDRGTTDEYEAPALVELGSIEDLTHGGSGFGTDFRAPADPGS
jgi:hypothetical protein